MLKFKFFERNKDNTLDIVKGELLMVLSEAKKDSTNIEDFVQMVGLVMTKTTGRIVRDLHINYVTSRLLDSPQKTEVGTGEGKSVAEMLLYASQVLLGRWQNVIFDRDVIIKRDLEDYQGFFKNLDLKPELTTLPVNGRVLLSITGPEYLIGLKIT